MTDLLIMHGGALGDLLLTLQLARHLAGVTVASTLQLVSRTDPGDLSTCRPSIVRRPPEGLGLHWLYAEGDDPSSERLQELVARRQVLNALGGVDSVVHRRLLRLHARAVFSFDPRPDPGVDTRITTQWQRELEEQGLSFRQGSCENHGSSTLSVPDGVRDRGRKQLTAIGAGGQPVLVHPGSGGWAKCWPLRCFLDVARRLRAQGLDLCFVTGPVEVERWAADDLEAIRGEFPLLKSPGPDELLSVLTAARTLISNDAGPAHLAALLGTPTVTVFGPTSATVWGPLGRCARIIVGEPDRRPDDWGVDPQQVVDAALACLPAVRS